MTSDVQTARLLRIQFPDCEASVDFRTQNATVTHFWHVGCPEREASVDFSRARHDSYTLSGQSDAQNVRLLLILAVPDATVTHFIFKKP